MSQSEHQVRECMCVLDAIAYDINGSYSVIHTQGNAQCNIT